MLKKWFPLSFKYSDSVTSLVIGIIIHVVVGILAGLVIGLANILFGWIPLLGSILAVIFKAIGAVIDVYVTAGIVIEVLAFCKVIKD
jgi:uncharacterized oligopeptide transporter (OPT) family protein